LRRAAKRAGCQFDTRSSRLAREWYQGHPRDVGKNCNVAFKALLTADFRTNRVVSSAS
jgi:hypothetical protein